MKNAVLPLLALSLSVLPAVVQGAEIANADPAVRYVGRFDRNDPAGPRCAWSASSVVFAVSGGSVSVTLNDSGKNHWQVVINGEPTAVLALEAGEKTYPVAMSLPTGERPHTIELVKRTEASQGVTQILGFEIDEEAKLLAVPARPRRLEVIGDSISCGYGNESPNKETHFLPEQENGWLAYGAVAARAVNADYVCVAWSGKKLWPDNTIVSLYDRTLPDDAGSKWDFAAWTPDAVVINLGTNDFGPGNPEEAGWVAAYVKFIQEIRSRYPLAPIYCAQGTMMGDWPPERKPRTVILGYLEKVVAEANAAGGPPVRLIDFGVQQERDGIGGDWHPSVKTHALMAETLTATLQRDLGW